MELSDFSYLVDENISNSLIEFLQNQNLKVINVREQGWQGTFRYNSCSISRRKKICSSHS